MPSEQPDLKRKKPPAALALALIAGTEQLAKPRKKHPRVRPKLIMTKNRFASKAGCELTEAEIEFGGAMASYLARWGGDGWTCGQVLDVLLTLGYCNQERDFEICIHRFASAIFTLKRGGRRKTRRRFPTWGEVLNVAMKCGWTKDGDQ